MHNALTLATVAQTASLDDVLAPKVDRQRCVIDILDMHCAGCAVLIESALEKVPGVTRARVHYATQRAKVTFDPLNISAEQLLQRIEKLGYSADIEQRTDREAIAKKQRNRYIRSFGLSALCAMQVMMVTLPRYIAGADMEPELAPLLDWAAFFLVLPVIGWTARPFYRGMLREVAVARPGMDAAITLGLAAAFGGSMWHLLSGTGALYFDSVTMFVTLLLGVRWLEWEQREQNRSVVRLAHLTPSNETVLRFDGKTPAQAESVGAMSTVPLVEVRAGDRLWVRTGDVIPVDGTLESAIADCDEALLTGESVSVRRVAGHPLIAGAINVGAAFTMCATCTAEASTDQRLMRMADDASKPESLAVADRVARYFMPSLIAVATVTFLVLLPQGFDTATERAIAVLIISCPCALALAAPAAHAAGFAGLLKRGIVTQRASAIAVLARADVFVLDKTGTLSEPYVERLAELRTGVDEGQALSIIAALERASNHPLAKALQAHELQRGHQIRVDNVEWVQGQGVSGAIAGINYRFGRAEFSRRSSDPPSDEEHPARLWLSDGDGVVAAVDMSERPKAGVIELIDTLKRRGVVEIASGDHDNKTRSLADSLDIDVAVGDRTPEQKAARIKQLQAQGHIVAMIGDGINDSVAFGGADVAIAVSTAAYAARASADMIATSDQPAAIAAAIRYSQRISSVVKGNFAWAIGYNLVAVPIAIVGWIDPLVASVGMAASSAAVMLNVMRLRRDDGVAR